MLNLLRQINWTAIVPHILLLILFMLGITALGMSWDLAPVVAAVLYLGVSVLLQNLIPFHHRNAMKAYRSEDYDLAQMAFQSSYDYFKEKAWLDDYRSIFILSMSKMSYKEIALVNIALCEYQKGDLEAAKAKYEAVLLEYPNSQMAKDAIDYINNPDELEDANISAELEEND